MVCTIIHSSAKSKDGSFVEQKNRELFKQKKNHKAVAMVITLTQGLILTILQAQSTWERTQLSRQKPSALSRQNYDVQAAFLWTIHKGAIDEQRAKTEGNVYNPKFSFPKDAKRLINGPSKKARPKTRFTRLPAQETRQTPSSPNPLLAKNTRRRT
jgi:hypothetical protein